MSKLLKSTHEGIIQIGETELKVAVLEDGTRLINYTAIFKAFGRTKRGAQRDSSRVHNMPAFLNAKNLQPFVGKGLMGVLDKVEYIDRSKNNIKAFKANILPLLCKVYLDAREANVLKTQQIPLARASEILLLGLSHIGITALIDEATGYQYERERFELQKILEAYISDQLLPWQKRFPNEFYKQIFRLNGWDFTIGDIKKRPGVIGKWTNNIIYKQLPKGVLEELKSQTPIDDKGRRKHKYHQLLSTDVGHPHLSNQLTKVITIMQLSKNWKDFEVKFNQLYGQTELDFPDEEIELTGFNKNLDRALNYNPSKD